MTNIRKAKWRSKIESKQHRAATLLISTYVIRILAVVWEVFISAFKVSVSWVASFLTTITGIIVTLRNIVFWITSSISDPSAIDDVANFWVDFRVIGVKTVIAKRAISLRVFTACIGAFEITRFLAAVAVIEVTFRCVIGRIGVTCTIAEVGRLWQATAWETGYWK